MRDIAEEKRLAVEQRYERLLAQHKNLSADTSLTIGDIASTPQGLRYMNEIADLDGAGVVSPMTAKDFRIFLMAEGLRQSEWPVEETEITASEREQAMNQRVINYYLRGGDLVKR